LRNTFERFFPQIFWAIQIGSADGAAIVNMGGGLDSGGETMLWPLILLSWLMTK
jgi:hypothetical protein